MPGKIRIITDQCGYSLSVPENPVTIVSLVPSQTELLFDLGLGDRVAGITKFCVHPESWFRTKTRVGGTKQIRFETIEKIRPDLILANKEENEREQIIALKEKYPVWTSDISTLQQALGMINEVAVLTGTTGPGSFITEKIRSGFEDIKPLTTSLSVAYMIWKDPWMVAGGDTFIHDMLTRCGLRNIFSDLPRYPQITLDQLKARKPDLIFLSSEPFPFGESHVEELQSVFSGSMICKVDGEMFSWYGSRLIQTAQYLKDLQFKLPGNI